MTQFPTLSSPSPVHVHCSTFTPEETALLDEEVRSLLSKGAVQTIVGFRIPMTQFPSLSTPSLLSSSPLKSRFLQWVAQLRLHDCAAPLWPPSPRGLCVPVPPDSPHSSGHRQTVPVVGGILLGDPLLAQPSVVSSAASTSGSGGSSPSSFSDADHRPPDRPASTQLPRPPSRRLAAFRRLRGLEGIDDGIFQIDAVLQMTAFLMALVSCRCPPEIASLRVVSVLHPLQTQLD